MIEQNHCSEVKIFLDVVIDSFLDSILVAMVSWDFILPIFIPKYNSVKAVLTLSVQCGPGTQVFVALTSPKLDL